ncbi:hypothetical protein RJ639_026107, partial [Escallonia herrerae]
MCHAHRVIHRDLKAENFLYASSKESAPFKAIDFGLSIFFEPACIFRTFLGSYSFIWCVRITMPPRRATRDTNDLHNPPTDGGVADAILPTYAKVVERAEILEADYEEFQKEKEEQRHRRGRAETSDKNKGGGQNKT